MSGFSARGWRGALSTGAGRRRPTTTVLVAVAGLVAALFAVVGTAAPAAAVGSSCGASINLIACENSQTDGVTDSSVWDITGAGDDTIQGFSTDISVNAGGSIGFKIDTTLSYKIDVYRLGYYGGKGARLWASDITHNSPARQPSCLTDPSTLLYDCGNWSLSATWSVPSEAVSGVYIARLTATNGDASHITFIVRNDSSTSDIVYQTSDETWQAYNLYGGSDFYQGTSQLTNSQARAFKISYNRPFATRGSNSGRDFLFSNEYPTIRFLERNGYDVSYISGIDTDRFGAAQLTHHKVFMSVGHDEYWSQQQRMNVENARDAGVNLMFLSGNEVYWRTRFEPSIDSSHSSYRTLVCYKETWDDSPTDPTGSSTATFRDPRFATGVAGGYPENALTGTMFMSNSDDLAIKVSGAEGKLRLWRGTSLGSVADTTTTTLAPHTIGYESDEDVDNGYRPAGLIDLSTTTGSTPQYLTDFGSTVVPGTTTHHLTLYRASSGALVFGAGTIQWGWGLDQAHDGDNSNAADSRIQQATLNMLADMSATATTLMPGLVAATRSSDSTAPTSTFTSPSAGSSIANGTTITVSGTSADNGGGIVAGVEVSLDAGSTWHRASGTTSWTYTGVVRGSGSGSILVRATDDSANIETPKALAATVNCPCSLFGTTVPKSTDSGDASSVELGVKFTADTDGYVSGIRFYKASSNTGTHIGSLWTSSGSLLATGTFTNETSSGWQTLQFSAPVAVTANTVYVASYYAPSGHYSADPNFFYYKPYNAAPLHASNTLPDASSVNGVFSDGHGFPSSTFKAGNYYVDVSFSASSAVAPTVTAQTPTPGASSIPTTVKPTATFSKAMNATTISFALKDPNGNSVPGSVSYDAAAKTATFSPSSALADGVLYSVTVAGADINGNQLATPATWQFRTAYAGQVGGSCPCSLFADGSVPTTVTVNDTGSVELGIKFTADTDGIVTGVRFYKGQQNTGTHTGTLWSASGAQLATGTFSNESTTGWQTLTFATPVQVTAGTTYIASYHTSVGYYSATSGAYASAGVDNFPLHAPTHASVYNYATGFPTNGSDADYGVDVVFTVPASVVPSVSSSDPANGDTNESTASTISATFNTAILAGTATMTVTPSGGSAIAGAVTLDAKHRVLTFTPSAALAAGKTYAVVVSGARSLATTAQSGSATWTFTTGGGTSCPCQLFAGNATPTTIDSGDGAAVSLGVKIVPATSGFITAVRFYKSAANTGTHTGTVYDAQGNQLATATFSNETASGWQTASLGQSVPVTAGATYTVAYYAPNGHYSASSHFFDTDYVNGPLTVPGGTDGTYAYGSDTFPSSSYAASNYWVDAVFTTSAGADTTPPTVRSVTPLAGATSVSTGTTVTATFSEPVTPASASIVVKDPSGTTVAGGVGYDATAKVATFTPAAALAVGTKYTAAASATDTGGNAMTAAYTWSFTTAVAASTGCPCSVWSDSATPANVTDTDARGVELGLKFTADTTGQITGARFYKGPQNTGTHTATLWSSTGQQLTTGTFTSESSTGWQTMTFSTAVAVTAGTTYVISYHTNTGHFSYTGGAFSSAGVDNAPLHVPAHAALYSYGAGGFPTTASDTNYWVDVVYNSGTPTADTTPPTISAVSATPSGTSLVITWTTDEVATNRVDYGTSSSALSSNVAPSGSSTSHSVTITGITANTRYYYRVTSADPSGNSTTAPVTGQAPYTWAPTTTPVTDTTSADFTAGTRAGVYVAGEGDGAVISTPTVAAEFAAAAPGWTSTATATGGSTTYSAGLATVKGATLVYNTAQTTSKMLETRATLALNQSIGWVAASPSTVRFTISVNASNALIGTVYDGTNPVSTQTLIANYTVVSHVYRIEWTSTSVAFFIDNAAAGAPQTISAAAVPALKATFADTVTTDANLIVDWARLGVYSAPGTLTSRVQDAKASVIWDGLSWTADLPAGTSIVVKVRTGNTATPDATWSAFATVSASGGAIGATSRYLQYQITVTTSSNRLATPSIGSVQAAFHV